MKRIFFILSFCAIVLNAQQKSELFPEKLMIQPFTANFLEPKVGFLFQNNSDELRLDIGNSIDIYKINYDDGLSISFGADLFTYTLLRSEKDFHFPVDAVDYLFGINAGLLKKEAEYSYGMRFRLSHISAHFVDGHIDQQTGTWFNGKNPIVYSREFIELMPFIRFKGIRLYAGFTFIFHVDPEEIGKDIYHFGTDYFARDFISNNVHLFAGYDLRIINNYAYRGNNSIVAGIKAGKAYGRGISLYFNYYSGKSIHGEYFDSDREFTGIGLNLDL